MKRDLIATILNNIRPGAFHGYGIHFVDGWQVSDAEELHIRIMEYANAVNGGKSSEIKLSPLVSTEPGEAA